MVPHRRRLDGSPPLGHLCRFLDVHRPTSPSNFRSGEVADDREPGSRYVDTKDPFHAEDNTPLSPRGARSAAAKKATANPTRLLVTDYLHFHRSQRRNARARTLIYTGDNEKHGFVDRFLGILHAYLLAVLSGRVLLVGWRDPLPLSLAFESAPNISVTWDPQFDAGPLPYTPEHLRPPRGPTMGPPLFCECSLDMPGALYWEESAMVMRSEGRPSMRRFLTALRERDSPRTKALAAAVDAWRAAAGESDEGDALYEEIFREILRPSRALLSRAAPRKGLLWRVRYVAVHARIFHLAAQRTSIPIVVRCLARRAAAEADAVRLPKPHVFFLASDTPEFAPLFRGEIDRWSAGAEVVEIGEREQPRERFVNTAADLLLLSKGVRLVSLPSGLANLARYTGDVPHRRIRVEDCLAEADALKKRS